MSWDIFYKFEGTLFTELHDEHQEDKPINAIFRQQVVDEILSFIQNEENKKIIEQYFDADSKKKIVFLVHKLSEDKEDPEGQKAFMRLNAGKPPLTSSELIRALYMVQESGIIRKDRLEISKEWELIENYLSNDTFWCMFKLPNRLEKIATRIDRLFAIVLFTAFPEYKLEDITPNPRIIFETLENKKLVKDKDGYSEADLMAVWHEIMRCFWWMQSCYKDIEIFNYLGWLKLLRI